MTANRVLYRDGRAVAALVAGNIQRLEALSHEEIPHAETMLVRDYAHAPPLELIR